VHLQDLAERASGFSGAQLAGVVRAAAAYALERAAMDGYRQPDRIKVTKEDFDRGLCDVVPGQQGGEPSSPASAGFEI
jgi:SpoVK/Ycf46/Vps4 family AAA+-type ATPase